MSAMGNGIQFRFRRWAEQDAWDALFETFVDLSLTDDEQHRIDSTIIRAHSQAAGAKEGRKGRLWSNLWRFYEQDPRPF